MGGTNGAGSTEGGVMGEMAAKRSSRTRPQHSFFEFWAFLLDCVGM